jgi:hypothetical protein
MACRTPRRLARLFDVTVFTRDTYVDHTVALLAAGEQDAAADTLLVAVESIRFSVVDGELVAPWPHDVRKGRWMPRKDRAAPHLAAWERGWCSRR